MSRFDADVIVIGGGPAGCAAAIRLVQQGHDVLVLERLAEASNGAEAIESGELLAPGTQHECDELGVAFEGPWVLDRMRGVRNVYPDLSWTYHALPDGISYLNVDRGGFDAALRTRFAAVGGRIAWSRRATGLDVRADEAIVSTAEGPEYRAPLVIDAGGRHALAPRIRKLKTEDPEFRQIAVALFFSDFPDAAVGFWDRHFYGDRGAMISGARIRPGLFRLVLEADLADKQADRAKPAEFFERVAERFDPWFAERLARAPRLGEPWAMAPLAYRVTEVAGDRLLLAGDATGYLSPLTGMGVEFAMRMGRLAALAAHRALAAGDCSASAFAGYVDDRRSELETAITYLRHVLRHLRDRDVLLRAAHDDEVRSTIFGPPLGTVTERGHLRDARVG
ncbi:MAG TPA: FAD-dependent oxidoreductase [Candidatus Eisenbacteria bacterium]|nr:FAD-dependent oxidoreductase [Candidatus Eisenbacteria bacterium]